MKKLTTEEFIKKALVKHNNKYDYSKTEYINNTTKVCIICPIHGEFWQTPSNHLNKSGCPLCGKENMAKSNKQRGEKNFIPRAIKKYGDKYDYSKVKYIDTHTKVCIICPIHGEFWQSPDNFINGCGCPICKQINFKKLDYSTEEWIERAREIHGNRYDYSKVDYKGCREKVCIICPIHGEFYQVADYHLNGQGCSRCSKNYRYDTKEFIEKAKLKHGNKYDYSKVEYKNNTIKVCIICPIHGEFWQTPNAHLNGNGCPICKESKLEITIRKFLIDKNIDFIPQKKFDWLGKQSLDFYLPKYSIAIECQGIQHFEPRDFSGHEPLMSKILFIEQKKRDEKKKNLCEENGIKVIYFLEIKHYEFVKDTDCYFTNLEDLEKYIKNAT